MSSISPRRSRRSRRQAIRNRNPSVEVISFRESDRDRVNQGGTCIDLTCDDDDIIETNATIQPVVDLTNIIDSPIVILSTPDSPPVHRPRRRRHARVSVAFEESDSDEDLLELPPFDIPDIPDPSTSQPPATDQSTAAADLSTVISPDRTLTCPICLDAAKEIRGSGRQIFSTTCGHLFCSECITDAIRVQKKCPTCRKRLSLKQVHPIFI